jgi:single-stranded DNA-binding protein
MQTKNSDGSWTFCGGLVRNEVRTTNTGKKVANFALQVGLNKDEKKYANCVAWERFADCISSYSNGDTVIVTGTMKKTDYTKKDGTEGSKTECTVKSIVNGCQFKDGASVQSPGFNGGVDVVTQFEEIDNLDGELPF